MTQFDVVYLYSVVLLSHDSRIQLLLLFRYKKYIVERETIYEIFSQAKLRSDLHSIG